MLRLPRFLHEQTTQLLINAVTGKVLVERTGLLDECDVMKFSRGGVSSLEREPESVHVTQRRCERFRDTFWEA